MKRKPRGKRRSEGGSRSQRPKGRSGSRPVIDPEKLPPGKRMVLTAYPVRNETNELKWLKGKDGLVVIKIRKRLTGFERRLKKVVGGPDFLRIPLDGPGSLVWRLSDGKHNIVDICEAVHKEFKEEVEPVLPRIVRFIEHLLKRNLLLLKKAGDVDGPEKDTTKA